MVIADNAVQEAERFLAEEEAWARPALREAAVAWWDANITGDPAAYERMEAADKAVNAHYATKEGYQRVSDLLEVGDFDPLLCRRLERQQRAYLGMQAPRELLDRITAASAALQEKYSTYRGTLDGQPRSDNELEDILRDSTDSARVQAAWEARKLIGTATADDVRRLAELRNESARAVGFPDFWQQQMQLEELDPAWLVKLLDEVDRATAEPFTAMKRHLDERLAARFGIQVADLRPWHYGGPFFQETPDVFAPPADPLYADKDVVELSARTYRQLGFPNIDAILARSDLYPRGGKNQHAYATDIDREGDVRTFLNVERNARWMGTLLHELGHTIYMDGIDRQDLPYDLRDDPQGFLNEGFAMFCEQPQFEPAWLTEMVGLPRDEAERIAPELSAQERANLLAFVRWCLVIVQFERAFYADPAQDLNRLWWDLVEKYQQVRHPEGRDEADWAAKIHVAIAPAYYHKYLLGRMFAAQLTETLNRDFGGWWAGGETAGRYIKDELFAPGATYPWARLVEHVTGKPLGVEALGRATAWD